MSTRRDCFDWPERPHLQGALSAPVPATPVQPVAGAPVPGGEGLAPLLTLAAILALPVGFVVVAQLLIEALLRMPIAGVLVGAAGVFGGAIGYALTAEREWHVEGEEHVVITSPLFEMRLQR